MSTSYLIRIRIISLNYLTVDQLGMMPVLHNIDLYNLDMSPDWFIVGVCGNSLRSRTVSELARGIGLCPVRRCYSPSPIRGVK